MRPTAHSPSPPRVRTIGVLAAAAIAFFSGCSPQSGEEAAPSVSVPQPPPPALRILTDLDTARMDELRILFSERVEPLVGGEFAWKRIDPQNPGASWDVALVESPSVVALGSRARDLKVLLEQEYPPYNQDFVLSAELFNKEGHLVSIPIQFFPDFLYTPNAEEWRGNLDRAVWDEFIQAGSKVGGPSGPHGEWWKNALGVPDDQWVDLQEDPLNNEYTKGEVSAAIWDRSWMLADRSRGRQILPLASLVPKQGVPAWAMHLVLAEGAENATNAERLLKALVVDFQETLMNWGGRGLPVRRSIYQSPRMQGALLGAPKAVFDRTLEALAEPAKTDASP